VGKAEQMKKTKIMILAISAAVLVAFAAGMWWYYSASRVATDDARIKGTIVPISSKIEGKIVELAVENGTVVKKGMILARLDGGELEAQLLQAKANLAAAEAKLSEARGGNRPQEIAEAKAGDTEAGATLEHAEKEYARMQVLYEQQAVSEQQLDSAKTALAVARAAKESRQQKYDLTAAGTRPEDISYDEAQVQAAAAQVKNLEAQLENTWIRASADGIVDSKAAEIGQTAIPGLTLFHVVNLDDVWLSANVEETYLGRIHVGSAVDFKVDAYPGVEFHGTVTEIGAAAGSQFSLLPAENTSGNFTKVTQRFEVKVKVETEADFVLKPGMSAVVTIHS
jgi:multidrug resistance efflux pump